MKAHAAILGLVIGACRVAGPGQVTKPAITTGPLSWKIEETEYSFSATGAAQVQISDTAHPYLLIYRVYWDKKLDPKVAPDTASTVTLVVPRLKMQVEISDHETRCTEYSSGECLRRTQDPVARIELVGWTRFERP